MLLDHINEYETARAEIDCWRGRLMEIFARGEIAIAQALVCAAANGRKVRLPHLAGQRLEELTGLSLTELSTKSQSAALTSALDGWSQIEARRPFLAHGTSSVWIDGNGGWAVVFDRTDYRAGIAVSDRWFILRAETDQFENDLMRQFGNLSSQLGQLKKRIESTVS